MAVFLYLDVFHPRFYNVRLPSKKKYDLHSANFLQGVLNESTLQELFVHQLPDFLITVEMIPMFDPNLVANSSVIQSRELDLLFVQCIQACVDFNKKY